MDWLRLPDHVECEQVSAAVRERLGTGVDAKDVPPWGRRRRYRANTLLWPENAATQQICRLLSGRVHIVQTTKDGQERLLQVVHSGELFGELCFCRLQNVRFGIFARAMTAVELVEAKVGGNEKESLLKNPIFCGELLGGLCRQLRESHARVEVLGTRDGQRRVELALLELARQRGGKTSGKQVRLTAGHAEVAQFAGMTRTHVTTILNRLREEGAIDYDRGSAMTIDVQRLRGKTQAG